MKLITFSSCFGANNNIEYQRFGCCFGFWRKQIAFPSIYKESYNNDNNKEKVKVL
jgi:hypothetical protein